MGKIKSFVARHKNKVVTTLVAAFMACVSAVSCFAAEESTAAASVQQAFSDGVSNISDTIIGYILIAIPAVLAILAVYISIKKGLSFFKSLIGR